MNHGDSFISLCSNYVCTNMIKASISDIFGALYFDMA